MRNGDEQFAGHVAIVMRLKPHFHLLLRGDESTLRHSFASKLVKQGASLFEVSVLLGHSDPRMTQRYAHLATNDASKKAVGIVNSMHL